MPRKCLVCESNQLKEIDRSLVDNESFRIISNRFGLSQAAVQRHKKNHLPKLLVKAKNAEEVASSTSLLGRVQELLERATRLADEAERSKNLFAALQGVREIRGVLELIGRISGELQSGTRVGIQIINGQPARMVAVGSEEWRASMRDLLDEIVNDFSLDNEDVPRRLN